MNLSDQLQSLGASPALVSRCAECEALERGVIRLQREARTVLAELARARYSRHIALLDLKALAELGDMPELAAACAAEIGPLPAEYDPGWKLGPLPDPKGEL